MPREARKKSESGIYHVMLRGINRQTLFEEEEDCTKYLQCLAQSKVKSGFILYAYCLMGNHVHLLLKEGTEPLQQIFKRIGASYVFWYNWKYKRSGPLFQDRYISEPIVDDKQFLAVLRYIYQNPVKANLCLKPEDYPWSSYRSLDRSPDRSIGINDLLTDQNRLAEIIPEEQLRAFVEQTAKEQFLDLLPDLRLTDREAVALLIEISGIEYTIEFAKLQQNMQTQYLKTLHTKGCSIRQLVRISGITKARIESMLE
jgi:REP element-mobilizing transposase RayT